MNISWTPGTRHKPHLYSSLFQVWVWNCLLFPKVEQPQFIKLHQGFRLLIALSVYLWTLLGYSRCHAVQHSKLGMVSQLDLFLVQGPGALSPACTQQGWRAPLVVVGHWYVTLVWSPLPSPGRSHLKGELYIVLTELWTRAFFWLFPQSQGHLKSFSVFCHLRPFANARNVSISCSIVQFMDEDVE